MKHFHVHWYVKVDGRVHEQFQLFESETDFGLKDFVDWFVANASSKAGPDACSKILQALEDTNMCVVSDGVELKYPVIKEVQDGEFLVLCPITSRKSDTGEELTKDEYHNYMEKGLFVWGEWCSLAKEMAKESITLTCIRCDSITMVSPDSINKHLKEKGIKMEPVEAGQWRDIYSCPKCYDKKAFSFSPIGDEYEKTRLEHIAKLDAKTDSK